MKRLLANDHRTLSSDDLRRRIDALAQEIDRERYKVTHPEVFYRRPTPLPEGVLGEICFLRRWNSDTPIVAGGFGGGYFMRWNDLGTLIDPGCSFVRAFVEHTRYSLADVNMVIATHDHMDHCHDLGPLIGLLRRLNRWRVANHDPPVTWDVIASHGVYDQYASVLRHQENQLFLNLHKPLAPGKIDQVWEVPGYLNGKGARSTLVSHQRSAIDYHRGRSIEKDYRYTLSCTRTHHRELLGQRTGFGLTFRLQGPGRKRLQPCCVVSMSSDTAITNEPPGVSADELEAAWGESNLLVLHVGTMEARSIDARGNSARLPEHLGFLGVCDILERLKDSRLQAVVLAEWGSECGGYLRRSAFCDLVAAAVNSQIGAQRYYSITSRASRPDSGVAIIPCDLKLRVSLPQIGVWCGSEFVIPTEVLAEEKGEEITYRRL